MRKISQLRDQFNESNQTYNKIKFEKYQNLKGKIVVISGGSRGIGLEIGKRCAKDGANIVLLGKTI